MHPFLLAFVDSQAFKLMSLAFLLPFVLGGAVVVWLLVLLMRSGLRDSRRLRSPAVAATGWQHLGVATRLLPAAVIGLILLLVGLSEAMETSETVATSEESQASPLYQAALHQKEMRHQAKVAGRYMLADEVPAELSATRHTEATGPLDTKQLPTGRATPGQPPRAELRLWSDGTFTYYSTIVGDEAGAEASGYWRLQGSTWYAPQTLEGLRKVHNYAILFEFVRPLIGGASPLSGSTTDEGEFAATTLSGSCNEAGRSSSFALAQAPSPLAPLAPPVPQTLLAFSSF